MIPSTEDVLAAIQHIAARELDRHQAIRPEHALVEDLGLDSLTAMVLAVGLEDRFRVRLDEQDAASLGTVGDLIALVQRRAGDAC